mmetsp:Transcript_35816/g.71897  ORF Transcript_35816/g.71897 Transcript_35816/m.71897 type:complete len:115 (+) Transcript_35816:3-347(+)
MTLARAVGDPASCSTCTGTAGSITRGFRATIKGKLLTAPGASSAGTIEVASVEKESVGCGDNQYVHPVCGVEQGDGDGAANPEVNNSPASRTSAALLTGLVGLVMVLVSAFVGR